jgi:hypothetical protein
LPGTILQLHKNRGFTLPFIPNNLSRILANTNHYINVKTHG